MMVLRQDTDHAIHCLLLLADADRNTYVAAGKLARSVGASVAFIHKVVQSLKGRGVIAVRRGVGGGVKLAASPRSISLLDIIEAIQGRFAFARCNDTRYPCPRRCGCRLSRGLAPIEKQFTSLMSKTTLAQLQAVPMPEGQPLHRAVERNDSRQYQRRARKGGNGE